MSLATTEIIMGRIKVATRESPISVFKAHGEIERLDCVFGSTAATQHRIKYGSGNYVGSFTREDCKKEVLRTLKAAL